MVSKVEKQMSLGVAQAALEAATKELVLAQAGYTKASDRLALAEEMHENAMVAMSSEVATVRGKCKVISMSLK